MEHKSGPSGKNAETSLWQRLTSTVTLDWLEADSCPSLSKTYSVVAFLYEKASVVP